MAAPHGTMRGTHPLIITLQASRTPIYIHTQRSRLGAAAANCGIARKVQHNFIYNVGFAAAALN